MKRLISSQFKRGTWVDDLFEMSQKKKLGNFYIYYADFLSFNFFPLRRDSETFVAFSYGQIQLLKALISLTAIRYLSNVKALLL